MTRRRAVLVGVFVAFTVVSSVVLVSFGSYYYTYTSNYSYQVELSGNGTLSNATFLVPLPYVDGHSVVGDVIADGDAMYPIGRPGEPHDWNYTIVNTTTGPKLRITADEISFEPRYYRWVVAEDGRHEQVPIPVEEFNASDLDHGVERTFQIHVWMRSDHRINTRTPIGDEPLLVSTATRTETTCPSYSPRATCYTYSTEMTAQYDTTADTDVSIRTEVWAGNSWMYMLVGNAGNEYVDRAQTVLVGSQMGVVPASGYLQTGVGDYPWREQWRAQPRESSTVSPADGSRDAQSSRQRVTFPADGPGG
ncbi:hypothetical protein ACFO0N_22035 [Halobium salinum]|uniref:DUF1102 domain-containing protein n=1 Tax=Halobium salinum TaxID=1364940 RepID=A0ABD5PIV1_9EURY|nr:hypothetical protein [Halobium salinum]